MKKLCSVAAVMDFASELDLLVRARYPLLYVLTTEEERAEQAIAQAVRRPVYTWDFVEGYQSEGIDAGTARNNPLAALEFVERGRPDQQAVFVLRDFHRFLEDISVGRKLRNLARRLRSQPKTVVVLAPRLVIPTDLAEEITVLEFALPTAKEIDEEIGRLVADPARLRGPAREELVKACQGLTLNRIRQVLAKALARGGQIDTTDIELILEEKKQKIRQTQILDFTPATETITDIGGLDQLKAWLLRRGAAFSDQARRYGLPHPRGLLLVGVQGTGKSLTARAIAHHWRLPLLRLDVGRLFAGLVGESEARTRQMIQIAEALAPCVLFADEIDKSFGSLQGGDAGTASRVFGTFLTWMAEKTSPVFVVATANDVLRLPPELMRKGRFDEVFFVNLPTQAERAEIFGVHLARLRPHNLRAYDLARLAYETPDFSGAEIEQAIVEAMHLGFAQGRDFTSDDIVQAVATIVPLARTAQEQIQALQQWAAAGKARPASLQGGLLGSLQRRLESSEE
jgi:SpoVK/Ycf46/Vps4 family AAA+-type ATPase